MSTINEKGIAFSIDLLISFLVMMAMVYLILTNFNMYVEESVGIGKTIALEKNGVYFVDALVKTFDANGFANKVVHFSNEKRRFESNVLDYAKLKGIDEMGLGGLETNEFFVGEIYLIYKTGGREIIFKGERVGKDCVALERFVLVEGNKALLGVRVCNE